MSIELRNAFAVPVTADRLWNLLLDVEQIAPCVPGFRLEAACDGVYRGVIRVKVGAVTAGYDATLTFVERDPAAHRVVMELEGREKRGSGSVRATVTAYLSGATGQTVAEMVTNVVITGRLAQFGRGVVADVSSRMIEEFAANLTGLLREQSDSRPRPSSPGDGDDSASVGAAAPAHAASEGSVVLDLGQIGFLPVAKRVAVLCLLGAACGWLIRKILSRRS